MGYTRDNASNLEAWLRGNPSVYIHANLHFAHNEQHGTHWRSNGPIAAEETLLSIPHSYSLSYLNAIVDDAYPVFRLQRKHFTVEAIGFFYLMLQYINRRTSFWKPYLESLQPPDHNELTTPLWFEREDSAWLTDTDVAETMAKRKLIYEEYYRSGLEVLVSSGIDVSQFSWDLFCWSITMFTSRSFSSIALTPQDSKYWTTYKTGSSGNRQTVLLDMSHSPSADLDFSVLFPGMDAGNHDHQCEALWTFDAGRFSLKLQQQVDAGLEICNNYGPKANHELLQGYGFTVENSPHDTFLLTLRAPSRNLQVAMKPFYAGYFDTAGTWLPEKATFGFQAIKPDIQNPQTIFKQMPSALLQLLVLIIRDEKGIAFEPKLIGQIDFCSIAWQRYLPHLARTLSQSLAQKYSRLMSSTPVSSPTNRKQTYAKYYRDGQMRILRSYLQGFNEYMQSIVWGQTSDDSPIGLATLEIVLSSLLSHSSNHSAEFLQGIEATAQSSDLDTLRGAGWEEEIWVLLLCYLDLLDLKGNLFCRWVAQSVGEHKAQPGNANDSVPKEQVDGLLEIVDAAQHAIPGSLWSDPRWTGDFIACSGARIFASESFVMAPLEPAMEPRLAVLWVRQPA